MCPALLGAACDTVCPSQPDIATYLRDITVRPPQRGSSYVCFWVHVSANTTSGTGAKRTLLVYVGFWPTTERLLPSAQAGEADDGPRSAVFNDRAGVEGMNAAQHNC